MRHLRRGSWLVPCAAHMWILYRFHGCLSAAHTSKQGQSTKRLLNLTEWANLVVVPTKKSTSRLISAFPWSSSLGGSSEVFSSSLLESYSLNSSSWRRYHWWHWLQTLVSLSPLVQGPHAARRGQLSHTLAPPSDTSSQVRSSALAIVVSYLTLLCRTEAPYVLDHSRISAIWPEEAVIDGIRRGCLHGRNVE